MNILVSKMENKIFENKTQSTKIGKLILKLLYCINIIYLKYIKKIKNNLKKYFQNYFNKFLKN